MPSDWLAIAANQRVLEPVLSRSGWKTASSDGVKPWTDDYSSVVSALRLLN